MSRRFEGSVAHPPCVLLTLTSGLLLAGCGGPPQRCESSCGGETSTLASGGGASFGSGGASFGGGTSGIGGCDACAQPWIGVLQFGTELDDRALALAPDPEGGVYVGGFQHGVTGATNIEPTGDSFGFVSRVLPSGELAWTEELDTPATETVEALAYDPTHQEVLIAGRTSGSLPGSSNQGQFDGLFAVLGRDGEGHALHQMGRNRPEHPTSIAALPNDRVLVAGYDDIFVPSNYVEAWEDGFVVDMVIDRVHSYAVTEQSWLRSDTPNADVITAIVADPAESGSFYSGGVTSGGPTGGTFVKKTGPGGSVEWTHVITKLSLDTVGALGLSPQGDLIVIGATFSTLGAQSYGQQDVYVLRLDRSTGDAIWTVQFGSSESDLPTDLAFDAQGNLYVIGVSTGVIADGYTVAGGQDIFGLKLDSGGALLSTWQTGTSADDWATSVAADVCGNVFVAGYTEGSLVGTHSSAGGQDLFVMTAPL